MAYQIKLTFIGKYKWGVGFIVSLGKNSNFTNVSADHGSPASHHRDQAGNILIIAIEVGKAVSCKDFLSDLQWKFSVKSIEIDVLSI